MKANFSLKTTRCAARQTVICIWLWILAVRLPVSVMGQANYATPYTFTTFAGEVENPGTNEETGVIGFYQPSGVAVDSAGNVYVADTLNCTIRKRFLASSVPAPILRVPSLNDGQFGFGITGLSGLAVDIESSADMFHWEAVGTYVLIGGSNCFVSSTTSNGTQFYRAHVRWQASFTPSCLLKNLWELDSLCPTPLCRVGGMLKYNNNLGGNAGRGEL
jgi:NHL repeat